ncbi:ribonuclease H-like domain-containing protein [Tanacetum coccineum]
MGKASGIVKANPKYNLHVTTSSPIPKSPFHALRDPNWKQAMCDEYKALIDNNTWVLVPRPPNVNIVRSMWLYKHKYNADGSLNRYKARLVANGRSQQQGIDCDETFSPVVKPATIRTVLSLAVSRQWPIHQLDVKNAFLHGHLTETVYMHQPPGFTDSAHSDYVCLLQKSLYGLKQAPRAWFQRFSSYVIRAGFYHSKTDSSLFIFHKGQDTAYLLLYVDDIILTASSTSLLQRIISLLHAEFAMTDLGPLNYFLGISATRTTSGIFLSQTKYATEILEQAQMLNCNPCRTPIDTEKKLGPEGSPVTDPTLYRSLAGSLQYLTFTRPDLSYAVQQLCLYMHDPREPHLNAMKRVLRYLRGTTDLGLQLLRSTTSQLIAYSDADWAGCPATRRSTSGYCVFLGDNLLTWSSKRQDTLSRSSAEAEYRGVANAVAETSWIRNLLRELHTPLFTVTLVYSAVYMSANPVQHQRTKHIEIDIHFVRDKVAAGQFDHLLIEWQGKVNEFSSILGLLKVIYLSSNNLTGQIPNEVTNLHGLVPTSTQLQSFEPTRFIGNAGLCGPPTTKKCPGDEHLGVPHVVKSESDGYSTDELQRWFYVGWHKALAIFIHKHNFRIDLELIANAEAFNKYNQVMNFLLRVKRAKFVLDEARRWVWKWELIASRINNILTSAGLVLCSDGTVSATCEKEVDCIKKQFDDCMAFLLSVGVPLQVHLHYEDILPVIMDKIHCDKRKEVHVRLDFGESPKKSRRGRGDSQNSSAGTLSARYRNPLEKPKIRDRLRSNDGNVFDRLGRALGIPLTVEAVPSVGIVTESETASVASKTHTTILTPLTESETASVASETASVECWAMPTWCHMFNSTLIGAARVWFDEIPPESIDGYKGLKAAFLAYFMQQKKNVKNPVEIHNIKQRDGETIEEFMEHFKIETGRMKGSPECM